MTLQKLRELTAYWIDDGDQRDEAKAIIADVESHLARLESALEVRALISTIAPHLLAVDIDCGVDRVLASAIRRAAGLEKGDG